MELLNDGLVVSVAILYVWIIYLERKIKAIEKRVE